VQRDAARCSEMQRDAARCSEMQRDAAEPLQAVAVPIAAALETALALRRSRAEPKVLRRALRRIEELLDE